jgi:ABC-type bacteriocin/lantibiotic exporter with double-glycine peptidase domain
MLNLYNESTFYIIFVVVGGGLLMLLVIYFIWIFIIMIILTNLYRLIWGSKKNPNTRNNINIKNNRT